MERGEGGGAWGGGALSRAMLHATVPPSPPTPLIHPPTLPDHPPTPLTMYMPMSQAPTHPPHPPTHPPFLTTHPPTPLTMYMPMSQGSAMSLSLESSGS